MCQVREYGASLEQYPFLEKTFCFFPPSPTCSSPWRVSDGSWWVGEKGSKRGKSQRPTLPDHCASREGVQQKGKSPPHPRQPEWQLSSWLIDWTVFIVK